MLRAFPSASPEPLRGRQRSQRGRVRVSPATDGPTDRARCASSSNDRRRRSPAATLPLPTTPSRLLFRRLSGCTAGRLLILQESAAQKQQPLPAPALISWLVFVDAELVAYLRLVGEEMVPIAVAPWWGCAWRGGRSAGLGAAAPGPSGAVMAELGVERTGTESWMAYPRSGASVSSSGSMSVANAAEAHPAAH